MRDTLVALSTKPKTRREPRSATRLRIKRRRKANVCSCGVPRWLLPSCVGLRWPGPWPAHPPDCDGKPDKRHREAGLVLRFVTEWDPGSGYREASAGNWTSILRRATLK